ncbi:MAG: glutathione S-transferase family protein [Sphingomonas sp.]
MEKLILHEYSGSGNCYKIRLTAALLGLRMERVEYDILKGETRTRQFRTHINALGRIPVLQVGQRFLPESNAACFYLADGSELIPEDRFQRADMLRWMFFEQYHHEPNVATLRFWLHMIGTDALSELQRSQIPAKRLAGEAALQTMDDHLALVDWLVGERASLADIALYAYTHVAEEGGFDLTLYPAIGAWIERIEALPRFVAMDETTPAIA